MNQHTDPTVKPAAQRSAALRSAASPDAAPAAPAGSAAAVCSCGAHMGDEMMTLAEVAELLRVPVATLRYWRHLGAGPRSFRIGRSVRYWRSEVVGWLDRQTRDTGSPKRR